MGLPVNESNLFVCVKEGGYFLKSIRQICIIRVKKSYYSAVVILAPVFRAAETTAIFLIFIPDPRITEALNHFFGVISGTVINYDNLKVGKCLTKHAFNGLADQTCPNISWDYYSEFGCVS